MAASTAGEVSFDLSGIAVRLRGLPADCAAALGEAWSGFRCTAPPRPALDIQARVAGRPVAGVTISAKDMRIALAEQGVRFELREGSLSVDATGRAELTLAPGHPRTQLFAVINLLPPALAWLLSRRHGAVLHAAGIVLGGRAVLLVGPEGSGKSTWVALAKAGGAGPLSDDLILIDAAGERPVVLGSPFRTKDFGGPGPGRWPLAAILFPEHGSPARLVPVSPMSARGRLLANLPWVAELLGSHAAPTDVIERLIERVPSRTLIFARDGAFLGLLAELAETRD